MQNKVQSCAVYMITENVRVREGVTGLTMKDKDKSTQKGTKGKDSTRQTGNVPYPDGSGLRAVSWPHSPGQSAPLGM